MKSISNVFILTMIWIICSARSCTNDVNSKEMQEKKLLDTSKDSIRQAFEFDLPNDQQLNSFEAKASQKLVDFADYLKIASDSSMDATFRRQAAEMVRKLFVPGKINTRKWCKVYPTNDLNTLDKLLDASLKLGMPCWAQPDQIRILMPLAHENDTIFKGRLSFYQKCIFFGKPNLLGNLSGRLEIDIYAIKKVKTFGNEQLRVWELYLGNIY